MWMLSCYEVGIKMDLDPLQYNPSLAVGNCTSIRNAISSLKIFLGAVHAVAQETSSST